MNCVKSGNIVVVSGYISPNKINQNLDVLTLPVSPMVNTQIIMQYGNNDNITFGTVAVSNHILINVRQANVAHRFNFSYVQKS